MDDINQGLITYVSKIMNEHYSLNDEGHDLSHAEYVINRSLKFAKEVSNINLNMVYVIAAYHDMAHHIDATRHEELSAELLLKDIELKNFFNDEQMETMAEAIEDHRSSLNCIPRSIYGKIVSSADRNTNIQVTLKRCYAYNKKHFSELSEDELIEKCRLFLLKKYGVGGYARRKMYFNDEEYNTYLNEITALALDKNKFKEMINEERENKK